MSVYVPVPEEEIQSELASEATRPPDVGADILPFHHLGGPRFEILSYLLRAAECSATGTSVTLMKASGDRGRDVLIYNNGELLEIVQCKNLSGPMTAPYIVREVLKIALHSRIDPSVLAGTADRPIAISIWCTGGFTEPAAELIDTWPKKWTQEEIRQAFHEVKERYKSLSGLSWANEEQFLLDGLSQIVRLQKREAVSLSASIRKHSSIYRQFFSGTLVVPIAELREGLREDRREDIREVLTTFLKESRLQPISDGDVRHMLERMESFSPEHRFYSGLGYVFGVSPQLIADMKAEDRKALFESTAKPILILQAFIDMVPLKAHEMIVSSLPEMAFENAYYPYVAGQALMMRALRQLSAIAPLPILHESLSPPELVKVELWDLIDGLCERAWDDSVEMLSPEFVPQKVDPGKLKAIRDIAAQTLRDFKSKAEFKAHILKDFRANLVAIRELVDRIEDYFPKDLLIVADSRSAFVEPKMMKRLGDGLQTLKSLMNKKKLDE